MCIDKFQFILSPQTKWYKRCKWCNILSNNLESGQVCWQPRLLQQCFICLAMTSLNLVTFWPLDYFLFLRVGGGGIHMTGQCTEDMVVCGGDYFSPVSDRGCCVVILTVVSICLFSHITGQVWPYIVYRRTWLKSMHVNIVYCAGTRSLAVHRKPVKWPQMLWEV